MTVLRRGNVTANDVGVEIMASVDVVRRTDDKGEKKVLSQRQDLGQRRNIPKVGHVGSEGVYGND